MSDLRALFERRWQAGLCSPATFAQVDWWLRHAPAATRETLACCAGLLQILQEAGDVAIPLTRWHGRALPHSGDIDVSPSDGLCVPTADQVSAASGAPWLGDGSAPSLLVHRDGLLLSWRHHRAEVLIAQSLHTVVPMSGRLSVAEAAPTIAALFAQDPAQIPHAWQRVAVATVIRNRHAGSRISVITGGPGTGKTTTVARLIAVLLMHGQLTPGAIRIAAPTGKAADRLAGSLRKAIAPKSSGERDELAACPPELRATIPTTATTIHTLLGANPITGALRHDRGHPLGAELVIIDEASMVDPVLLEAVLEALPIHAHLVLVGDPHQLTSVESGCLLSDLCAVAGVPGGYDAASIAALAPLCLPLEASASAPALRGMVCALTYNHRAGSREPLVTLARTILAGDVTAALAATAHAPTTAFANGTPRRIADVILIHAQSIQRCADPAAGLERMRALQILCAVRRGPWGASTIADAVDRDLASHARQDSWYHGRIVLITVNDRMRDLMNGDVGLCWRAENELRVFFPRPTGLLSFATSDLPGHEPAWALTIHKSQGSEYRHVHAVLPPSADHRLAIRELIYTAVTRASDAVTIWGTAEVFAKAVSTAHGRRSGLIEVCHTVSSNQPASS